MRFLIMSYFYFFIIFFVNLEFSISSVMSEDFRFEINLIKDYFNKNNINMGYFFGCWTKSELQELNRAFLNTHIRVDFLRNHSKIEEVLLEKRNFTYYGYVMDLKCDNLLEILENKTQRINFRLTRPWLLLDENRQNPIQFWTKRLENIKMRLDSNIKIVIPGTTNSSEFTLLEAYNPGFGHGGKTRVKEWANQNFYLQRRDLTGVTIRSGSVVLIQNHTGSFHDYMMDSTHPQLDTMSKFHYPIFLLLMDVHKFLHNLTVKEKWFGNLQSGIDGGIAELLYNDQIDISSTGGSQRPPRVDVIDYLQPSYHFRPCYIFRNPGNHDPFENEFVKPFSKSSWWTITSIAIIITILLKGSFKIEDRIYKTRFTWFSTVFITFSAIVQQGNSIFPRRFAGKSVFIILHFSTILLYNYYTSSILSSLLSKPPDAFRSLDELGRSKLEIGIEDLPYTITWFLIMNDSDVQYIYRHKVMNPPGANSLNIYPPDVGVARVARGGFAYHTQLDTGYPLIAKTSDQDAICDLAAIPMIPQVLAGTMIQKKSQYYELFHVTLRKAKAAGLIHRIGQIWEAKKPPCFASAKLIPVGCDQTFVAFLFYILGILLSLIICAVELVWFRLDLDSKFRRNTPNMS